MSIDRKVAIMQPYFLPYIGYFQLINSVDLFVIYDQIEYTKKGWINRNRILFNGEPLMITLSIKKGSDYANVNQRYLSDTWLKDRGKILSKIEIAYRKAPFYRDVLPLIIKIFEHKNKNLFGFIYHSILEICNYLDIQTELKVSSSIEYDNSLKGQDKVIDLCEKTLATSYYNPVGGMNLYNKTDFRRKNIELNFLEVHEFEYNQMSKDFAPNLSIIDVLMFNGKEGVKELLYNYRLL